MRIWLAPLEALALYWPTIEPMLRRATMRAGSGYEPIDVLREAMALQVGFWLVEDEDKLIGVAVGRVEAFPRKKAFRISFIAGTRLAEWYPIFIDEMDKVARAAGCVAIYAYGRPGWKRYWESRGVAVHIASEIMVRDLSDAPSYDHER